MNSKHSWSYCCFYCYGWKRYTLSMPKSRDFILYLMARPYFSSLNTGSFCMPILFPSWQINLKMTPIFYILQIHAWCYSYLNILLQISIYLIKNNTMCRCISLFIISWKAYFIHMVGLLFSPEFPFELFFIFHHNVWRRIYAASFHVKF